MILFLLSSHRCIGWCCRLDVKKDVRFFVLMFRNFCSKIENFRLKLKKFTGKIEIFFQAAIISSVGNLQLSVEKLQLFSFFFSDLRPLWLCIGQPACIAKKIQKMTASCAHWHYFSCSSNIFDADCRVFCRICRQLFWTKKPRSSPRSQSTALAPLREFRQLVPGDQNVFRIPDLEPDTTYFVQVNYFLFGVNYPEK